MAISEIIVVKPAEHNEEFYKEVFAGSEVTDEETYFAELRKMIATQLQPNSDMMFNRDVQDEIVKKIRATSTSPPACSKNGSLPATKASTPKT